jgi:hypothetical protein
VIPLNQGITCLEAPMMGPQTGDQASLFYEFRLKDRIPKDHLLRRINVLSARYWTACASMRRQVALFDHLVGAGKQI